MYLFTLSLRGRTRRIDRPVSRCWCLREPAPLESAEYAEKQPTMKDVIDQTASFEHQRQRRQTNGCSA